ncbi:MAG: glutamate 5-kinase [Arcobacter butzleri]|jgi:glutamate 5-kinase|nr:glutamate 5-kinase [Arcobacteraceae bacterium]MDY0364776.1 glutamate 5-kinase [Arcobacteraceae bacterium]NLO17710.1 glutamate 5-kinase [Aliarcobacter butzleri]
MKRVVLKVGSAVLTQDGTLALQRLQNLVDFIALLKSKYEVILVSSGAVASGYTALKLDKKIVSNKQALASIGQPMLMKEYASRFEEQDVICSQLLLTADDFDSRKRTIHAKNAIEKLLEYKVLPIINENDVTATDELVFGDNDQLAAHVTYYFDADMLVILTDIDGYYDDNPHTNPNAILQKKVSCIVESTLNSCHTPNNEFATGGIVTKLKAANFLLQRDKKMFLTSGFDLSYAKEFLIDGIHNKGTIFEN